MDPWFQGQIALVTGAGSGIGRATALAFAEHGAKVVVADRNSEGSAETVKQIHARGGEAFALQVDVTKAPEVEAMVAQIVARFGGLNYAINNAGIEGSVMVPLAKYSETTWDSVLDVNLKGVFLCMKYELAPIVECKGAIVNMASVAGLSGSRMGVAYHASKHGVVGLTKAAAIEYASKGVRVNAIAPGVIQTPMSERSASSDASMVDGLIRAHPLGRLGRAEEVANAAVWLCSKGASFITGHTLPVDGGFLIP
jgi:NAD(P)-dependent dehydrogenase (short-subunit alcohol dehydrogenase family)